MRLSPLLPVSFVLVVAALGSIRQHSHLRSVSAERDSIMRSFERYVRLRGAVAFAGESLPNSTVLAPGHDTLTLAELASRGYRYFYFYRDDCAACQTLAPLLAQGDASVVARTAFIHFDTKEQREPSAGESRFAWLVDSANTRPVGSVPSLLVMGSDGLIASTADFEGRAVVALLVQHALVSRKALDSAIASSRPAARPVADTLIRN